jgi:hypothetical protein
MPCYIIRKVRNQECWRVKNKDSGRIHAKCTTLEKAKKQVILLTYVIPKRMSIRKK